MTTQNSAAIEVAIQIGLIALLALWCFQIAAPFISPIVWAGIIAIGVYPLYLWLKDKTGLSAGWSATIVIRLPAELRLLQVGHSDYVHAPASVDA